MIRPCDLNAAEARKLIVNKQLSPVELTTSCMKQIENTNPFNKRGCSNDKK